jgi:hypothetical protein
MIKTLGVLLLCGCLAVCAPSSGPNLTGSWQFTLKSSVDGNTYTGTVSIKQSSSPVDSYGAGSREYMVIGTMNLANEPCATSAPLSGTISGSRRIRGHVWELHCTAWRMYQWRFWIVGRE